MITIAEYIVEVLAPCSYEQYKAQEDRIKELTQQALAIKE